MQIVCILRNKVADVEAIQICVVADFSFVPKFRLGQVSGIGYNELCSNRKLRRQCNKSREAVETHSL